MQLFTIGLWEMNTDGTYKHLQDTGVLVPTYTSEDIREFARVWTGWDMQDLRSNVELERNQNDRVYGSDNNIDPMQLLAERRDKFPKTLLNVGGGSSTKLGHLGDTYPLCGELPPQRFLNRGAVYRYHGQISMLGKLHDNRDGSKPNIRPHFMPDATHSTLYAALCRRHTSSDGVTSCSFPPVVTLTDDLTCYGATECNADLLRAVKIVDGDAVVFYTYEEPPCVRLQYFDQGRTGKQSVSAVCADPTVASTLGAQCCVDETGPDASGVPMCPDTFPNYQDASSSNTAGDRCVSKDLFWTCPRGCEESPDRGLPYCLLAGSSAVCHLQARRLVSSGGSECLFVAEPVKYSTAEERCAAQYENGIVCPKVLATSGDSAYDGSSPDWQSTCAGFQYAWTSEPCQLQVQVYSSGEVGVVDRKTDMGELHIDSGSKFRVAWGDPPSSSQGAFPTIAGNCSAGCEPLVNTTGSCLCDIVVEDEAVVTSEEGGALPTEAELRSRLMIGASAPEQFGTSPTAGYTQCISAFCTSRPGVKVHTRGSSSSPTELRMDTIFEFTSTAHTAQPSRRQPARYLLNRASVVHVGNTNEYVLVDPTYPAISNCTASSDYPSSGGGAFRCEQTFDGRMWTGWLSSNDDGYAIGAWIKLVFREGEQFIDRVTMKQQPAQDDRIKRVRLDFSDGSSQNVTVPDTTDLTTLRFESAVLTSYVNLTVIEVHGDSCIFPFQHGGVLYNRCAPRQDWTGEIEHFCATSVGSDGVSVQNHRRCRSGLREIRFLSPGHADTASSTPCVELGMAAATQVQCESAIGKIVLPVGEVAPSGTGRVNRIGSWYQIPVGCSLDSGSTSRWAPVWNLLLEVEDTSTRYWPVCLLAGGSAPSRAGAVTGFKFRNPPHFLPNTGESTRVRGGHGHFSNPYGDRDHLVAPAMHETEALLNHLHEHDNTPPFVAHRLIQRLVTSNPSPRYVHVVATAFAEGAYHGTTYSGIYGDLAATVAAILLDREARATILDHDPTHGQIREPLMKVVQFMRSMEFRPTAGADEIELVGLQRHIGQSPFESPSVFSFFQPEFAPAGPVDAAGMVAPEAQVSIAPNIIGYLNGMTSLINHGLTCCARGFGARNYHYHTCTGCGSMQSIANTVKGELTFVPANSSNPANVVDELSWLLTGGRLAPSTRDMLEATYRQYVAEVAFDIESLLPMTREAQQNITEDECLRVIKDMLGVPYPLAITSCSASSNAGACDRAHDGAPSTEWQVDSADAGAGNWIELQFDGMVTVNTVTYTNAWCWPDVATRARTILIEFSDPSDNYRVTKPDDCNRGVFVLDAPVATTFAKLTLESLHNSQCVFPFVYEGIAYNTCTNAGDSTSQLWCATSVDDTGAFDGSWGYCHPDGLRVVAITGASELQFYAPGPVPVNTLSQDYLSANTWSGYAWSPPPGCSLSAENTPTYNRDPVGCGELYSGCGGFMPVIRPTDVGLLVISASSISGGNPWRGVDGQTADGRDVVTQTEDDPWWQIDLGSTENITSIILHNSAAYAADNSGINVFVGGEQCASNVGPLERGSVTRIACVKRGRSVRIVNSGLSTTLRFTEVVINVLQLPDAGGSYTSSSTAEATALKHTLKALAFTAPDFHSTNHGTPTKVPREPPPTRSPGGRRYKSIVVVFMLGGADSYNMLVPHSGCRARATDNAESSTTGVDEDSTTDPAGVPHDLHGEYASIRNGDGDGDGNEVHMALRQDQLLQIDADPAKQPCSKFGLHPNLQHLQSLYHDGDAAILANVGALVEPVLRDDVWHGNGIVSSCSCSSHCLCLRAGEQWKHAVLSCTNSACLCSMRYVYLQASGFQLALVATIQCSQTHSLRQPA